MEAVRDNGPWYLMCPSECPGLTEAYGPEFDKLYNSYVEAGRYRKKIEARKLYEKIINSRIESGGPYICYKDHVNIKSNHKNIGTIKASNLCTEIMEYHSPDKYACCCLSSIILPTFVEANSDGTLTFNYDRLVDVARTCTRNLDKAIDLNFYPVPETEVSNFSERPIGVGVQGLQDVFFKFRVAFDSPEAKALNKKIFEAIYYGCMYESMLIAKERTEAGLEETYYKTYPGSPISQGLFQFDMWPDFDKSTLTFDWSGLREEILKYGVRNSLVTTIMPTASTSIISACTECIEPITSNLFTRRVLSGSYTVINKYLTDDLIRAGLWSDKMAQTLIAHRGSIQNVPNIPDEMKNVYKTCWEYKQKEIITMAAERGPFVDQSQSLNLFFATPDANKILAADLMTHKLGLKTGCYYLRTKPGTNSEQIRIANIKSEKTEKVANDGFGMKAAASQYKKPTEPPKLEPDTNFFESRKDSPKMTTAESKPVLDEEPEPACDMCSS
jgi:ribonucleoside-diphosphate reductase alpha subunit